MARQLISTIMSNIGAIVNQDPTVPTDGSADWTLWLSFINRAQIEWAESYDWEDLKKIYYPFIATPATAASYVSIGMPLDFRKITGPVVNYSSGVDGGESWPEILPERQLSYSISDKWFYVAGDISNGHYLTWNPGTLASGATLSIPYYSMPTSLVSSNQYPLVSDSDFLVQRTISYILESRSDPRYQSEEVKARERLLNMVENASIIKYNSYVNPLRITTPENRQNFRIGRN